MEARKRGGAARLLVFGQSGDANFASGHEVVRFEAGVGLEDLFDGDFGQALLLKVFVISSDDGEELIVLLTV